MLSDTRLDKTIMKITSEHISKFERIKKQFLKLTSFPKLHDWKKWSNDEIWYQLVTQVIVVGGSSPATKLDKRPDLLKSISYAKLSKLENEDEIKKLINHALREVGARYASNNITRCRKTQAICHNLKILKRFKGGPKGLLRRIDEFAGGNEAKRKIKYFMKIFRYIKSKGARDSLMEFGLIRDAIALDIRVQTVLRKTGIKVPQGLENDSGKYDRVEKELLEKICRPLGLSGVQFDRMIYKNYDNILKLKI